MKKLFFALIFLLVFASAGYSQTYPRLRICESDGLPCTRNTERLNFPNGTISIVGGVATVTLAGAGDALVANPLSQFAATTSAQLAGVVSNETGTSLLVFNTSPTLVTPILGTPTSVTLTNATGLPPTTGIVGWPANSAGVLTNNGTGTLTWGAAGSGDALVANPLSQFAATTSAQLLATLTNPTGTGVAVFGTSPAITTSLTTPSTTFSLVNTTATTVNFAGAATTLNIGASGGSVALNGIVTFQDNFRQIFNPGGANAGLNVGQIAGDPSTLTNGDLWYDLTGNLLRARINGASVSLGAGGGSGTINSGVTNILPKYTAATTLDDSLLSDDATTLSYAGTGGISTVGPLVVGSGSTEASALSMFEGTTPSAAAANSIKLQAPTDVTTAYDWILPPASLTGFLLNTEAAAIGTLSFVGFSGTGNVARVTAPTISGLVLTGTPSASTATSFILPLVAGAAPTANGSIAVDTTQVTTKLGGNGGITGAIPRVLSAQFSTVDTADAFVETTNERNFTTNFTIPANFLIANKALRVTLVVQFTASSSPPTSTVRLKLGATTIYAGTPAALAASTTNQSSAFGFVIQGTAAAGASVSTETGLLPGAGLGPLSRNTVVQGVNIATNASQVIQMSWQYSAGTAGNTITLRQLIIEELN